MIFPARPCKLFPPAPPTGKTQELGTSPRKCRRRSLRAAQLASARSPRPPRCPLPEEGCRIALWEAWLAPPRRGLDAILSALFLPGPSGALLAPSWPSAGGVLTRPSTVSPLSPGDRKKEGGRGWAGPQTDATFFILIKIPFSVFIKGTVKSGVGSTTVRCRRRW